MKHYVFNRIVCIYRKKRDYTEIDNEPATPKTPRFQRNVKRSLLNSFIESENATPIAERYTIKKYGTYECK